MHRRQTLALLATPLLAQAQGSNEPNKPLRLVVAYPAGGGSDFLARQLAPVLGSLLGQVLAIDNRPGADGQIGTDSAAKSAPDGYTLLTGDNGVMVFNPALYRKLPYAVSDFTTVGLMARFPLALAVHPAAGFATGAQWLEQVRKRPGFFSYASPGIGSPHHLAMELVKERTGSFIVHVPYRGTAFAIQDKLAGVFPMGVVDTAAGPPQFRSGKLNPLAVLSGKRIAALLDMPTFAELGVKEVEIAAWQGLFAPKDKPDAVVQRLGAELHKALTQPDLKAWLEDFGLEVTPSDGPALARLIQNEMAFWHALIKARKITAE
jgi:tripartite-type tricarboxylate transporter receptor subunit TctC